MKKFFSDLFVGKFQKIDLQSLIKEKRKTSSKNILDLTKFEKNQTRNKNLEITPKNKSEDIIYLRSSKSLSFPKFFKERAPLFLSGIAIVFLLVTFASLSKFYYWGSGILNEVKAGKEKILELNDISSFKSLDKLQSNVMYATDSFENAKKEVDFLLDRMSIISRENSIITLTKNFLESGESLNIAIKKITEIAIKIRISFANSVSEKPKDDLDSVIDVIENEKSKIISICDDLKESEKLFLKGTEKNKKLTDKFNFDFSNISEKISSLRKNTCLMTENFSGIEKMLGKKTTTKYLILFQNSNELRPTGGFIGSLARVDIFRSKITKINIVDVYDLDGSFFSQIRAPQGINKLTETLKLRDSNIYPDFSESAKLIAKFYEEEAGESVDFVIGIDQSFLVEILKVAGPINIELPDKATQIFFDAENSIEKLSFIIESKVFGQTSPKEVLGILIKKIINEFKKEKKIVQFLPKAIVLAKEKNIQLFSFDESSQNIFRELGFSGEFFALGENEDFLHISHMNIGGNKSDKFIKEKVMLEKKILSDGKIVNKLIIKRKNVFDENEEKRLLENLQEIQGVKVSEELLNIMGKGVNKQFIKIYVPKNSSLIKINGNENNTFIQGEENDRTFFGFEVFTLPSEESEIEIEYVLEKPIFLSPTASIKTDFVKSPGIAKQEFYEKIFLPEDFEILRAGSNASRVYKNFASFGEIVEKDIQNAVLVSQKESF